jgi:translation initiation factor 5A
MSDEIKLTHAGGLKKGSYLLIDGRACQVRDTQTSRPGKHGHAKIRIKAVDLVTGNTKEVVRPGHDNVEVPIIRKQEGQILSMDETNIVLMDMETFEELTSEIKFAEEEIRGKLEAGQTIKFWIINGNPIIKEIKEVNN